MIRSPLPRSLPSLFGGPREDRRQKSRHHKTGPLRVEELENRTLLSFSQPILSDTSVGPTAVAVGDFNGDGNLDVVTANVNNNTVSVLFGRGDGTFAAPVNYAVGSNPVRVAVGALQKNGLPDIVTANTDSNNVTVLLNNGDGTFRNGGNIAVDARPSSLALADLNGDGNLDLVVTCTDPGQSNRMDILLGNGDGSFRPRTSISDATWGYFGPVDLTIADFNRDGTPDIVTANFSYTVSYFQGNGDGTFQPGRSFYTDLRTAGITAADLRGNGILDLITAGDHNGWVTILRGNGNGTSQQPEPIGFGSSTSVAVADFRGTGKPDIAVVNEEFWDASYFGWGDHLTLLLNAGNGTFPQNNRQTYPLAYGPGSHAKYLAVGDFNNDGRPDLVFGLAQFNWVSVLLNTPDPTRLDVTASTAAVAGDALSVTVAARTADGSISPSYSGQVHFSTTDPTAVLPPDYTFTQADRGTHTFQVSLRRAGSQHITITDAANRFTAGFNVLISPANTSKVIVSGFPTPVRAGTVNTFFVSARDDFDNPTPSYRGTVQFTSSAPQAILPEDYTFTADDNGTHGFAVVLKTAGTETITAVDSRVGDIQGSQTVVVMPAALAALALTDFPTRTVAGTVHTLTVAAKDAYGNNVTDYRGRIHFTSSDTTATLPDDYTFAATDGGRRLFGAILQRAGVQSLTATDRAQSLSSTEDGIVVTPAGASYFVLRAPQQVQADTVFEVTVTAYDAYGNVATGYLGAVGFASSDPDALVPQDYKFTAADAGTHVFRFLLHNPGQQTIAIMDQLMSSLTGSTLVEVLPPG